MAMVRRAALLAAALSITLAGTVVRAEPIRIRYAVWVGFGPLFLAGEKGLFEREGVEVELVELDDHMAAFAAFYAGQVDALAASTMEAVSFHAADQESPACALVLDDSRGGDGVLAVNDIQTVADLRGRSVAYHANGISEFYINVLLKEAGLSPEDIEHVDIPADQAAEAFMLQEVDAAVTWEPHLTHGKEVAHGHLLTDTSDRPGLLNDCLMTAPGTFERRKEDFQAVARAWDAAVHYVEAHPDESHAIMARHMGGWLDDPAVFAEMLQGVAFYDLERNRAYFGTPDEPGQIYETVQYVIDVWSDLGVLKTDLEPTELIIHGIFED